MKKIHKIFKKVTALFASAAVVINSFLPTLPAFITPAQQVFASGEVTNLSFNPSTAKFTFTVNADDTGKTVHYLINYFNTDTQTLAGALGTGTTQFSTSNIDAGTCSSGTCVIHPFSRVITKVAVQRNGNSWWCETKEYTYSNGSLSLASSEETKPCSSTSADDLTAEETAWIAGASQDQKITLCHSTDSADNPYNSVTVDVSSFDGKQQNDHSQHTGPVFDPLVHNQQNRGWGDIIPPVPGVLPNGYNWTDDGQLIWNNNCSITAHITVIKHVINDDGGNALASDFTMTVTANNPSLASFPGSETGTVIDINPGEYSIDEVSDNGYAKTLSTDCSGTVGIADSRTCTITNNDIAVSTCTEGATWAFAVDAEAQGVLKNGNPITDPTRIDATAATGAANGTFFSLGNGGSVTLSFQYPVVATTGADLSFHEVTNGRASYPEETAQVEVSQDGITWYTIGTVGNHDGGNGVGYLNIESTGLSWIQYVRITDQTNYILHVSNSDGYDLDAVDATYGTCTPPDTTEEGEAALILTKDNDTGGATKIPGDIVTFTLTVTVPDDSSPVENVLVHDLPAGGFVYQPGSATASINSVSTSVNFAHEYASPGIWNIGNLNPGDVVVLAYNATIISDQQSGLYHDNAWAAGNDETDTEVLANATNDTPFVGTEVLVARPEEVSTGVNVMQTSTSTNNSSVLGASTELPATGAETAWIVLAGALTAAGIGCVAGAVAITPKKARRRTSHA